MYHILSSPSLGRTRSDLPKVTWPHFSDTTLSPENQTFPHIGIWIWDAPLSNCKCHLTFFIPALFHLHCHQRLICSSLLIISLLWSTIIPSLFTNLKPSTSPSIFHYISTHLLDILQITIQTKYQVQVLACRLPIDEAIDQLPHYRGAIGEVYWQIKQCAWDTTSLTTNTSTDRSSLQRVCLWPHLTFWSRRE